MSQYSDNSEPKDTKSLAYMITSESSSNAGMLTETALNKIIDDMKDLPQPHESIMLHQWQLDKLKKDHPEAFTKDFKCSFEQLYEWLYGN